MTHGNDSRLIVNAGMTESTNGSGGFLVPSQFIADILEEALGLEVVRPLARVLPMTSSQMTCGRFDYADRTAKKAAGLSLAWGAEATR